VIFGLDDTRPRDEEKLTGADADVVYVEAHENMINGKMAKGKTTILDQFHLGPEPERVRDFRDAVRVLDDLARKVEKSSSPYLRRHR
jgi:hypothetical protein